MLIIDFIKRYPFVCISMVLLMSFIPAQLNAAIAETPELVGDRPDFTESSQVVGKNILQVESGYTYTETDPLTDHTAGELLIRYGVIDFLELRFGVNSYVWQEYDEEIIDGKDDGSFGIKINLLKGSDTFNLFSPSAALIIGTSIPVGNNDLTSDRFEPEAKLALSWVFTEWLELGVNANYARSGAEGEEFNQYSASGALGIGITDTIGCFLEYYGFYPESKDGHDSHYLNGGFTLLVHPRVQIDTRAGFRAFSDVDEWFWGAGIILMMGG